VGENTEENERDEISMETPRFYLDSSIWNFRHLANVRRAARFLAVNGLHGYTERLAICNPLEVYEI
jgi:hypothetical protein